MKRIFIALTFCIAAMPAFADSPANRTAWHEVKTEPQNAKSVLKETDVEILSANGNIIITSNRPVHVKVFTILGRLVSDVNLNAGTSQLNIDVHGVYIVKIGELTCKVAI